MSLTPTNPQPSSITGKAFCGISRQKKNDDDDGGPVEFRQPLILIQGVYKGSADIRTHHQAAASKRPIREAWDL